MFVGPQGDFMQKVSNYVAKLWSDEDKNTISLLFQDSFALAVLIQIIYVRGGNSTSFSFQYVEAHRVDSVFK